MGGGRGGGGGGLVQGWLNALQVPEDDLVIGRAADEVLVLGVEAGQEALAAVF